MILPFVYRRYLDYGVFESLRNMHALIAAEVQRRELESNIKLLKNNTKTQKISQSK